MLERAKKWLGEALAQNFTSVYLWQVAPARGAGTMSEDRQGQGKGGTVWTEMGRYAHFGFQIALSIGLFLLGGWWLDGRIGTTPLLTIVGAMVGAAAAFYSMIRQLTSGSRDGSGRDPGRQEKER
jgi:hypothetical protein